MTIATPSEIISKNNIEIIRLLAAKAEQLGKLHPDQLKVIYKEKWFKLFVPAEYSGLGLDVPAGLRIEEALAWADGSLGWAVTLCAGANWFVGFLQPSLLKNIFNDNKVCLAGSGRTSGIAKVSGEGFVITGNWKYATGTPHATAFTANCIIEKNGKLLKDEEGNNVVYSFLFLREEVEMIKEWPSMGMIATASYSFSVQDLKVDNSRCFTIQPSTAILPQPVYQFPFLQFAETTLAVNISGMALRYLELCKIIFDEKKKSILPLFIKQQSRLEKSRFLFYDVVEQSWQQCANNKKISSSLLKKISKQSIELALVARQAVDELYPFCGLETADTRTEINRIWRNLHTASQHTLLMPPAFLGNVRK